MGECKRQSRRIPYSLMRKYKRQSRRIPYSLMRGDPGLLPGLSIVLCPTMMDGKIQWECLVTGDRRGKIARSVDWLVFGTFSDAVLEARGLLDLVHLKDAPGWEGDTEQEFHVKPFGVRKKKSTRKFTTTGDPGHQEKNDCKLGRRNETEGEK